MFLQAGSLGLIPGNTQFPKHCQEQPQSNDLEATLYPTLQKRKACQFNLHEKINMLKM